MIFEECNDAIEQKSSRSCVPLKPNKPDGDDTPYDRRDYLHLLGMLNYLLRSRPVIATALSYAATKSTSPTYHDYDNLLDVVCYLCTTKHLGLTIRSGRGDEPLHLKCYVDASFLSHGDSRGHSGYCLAIGDVGFFYSKSTKQQLVATSSTHAEVKALYQLSVDILYLINLIEENQRPISLPAVVMEDNNPTVQLSVIAD